MYVLSDDLLNYFSYFQGIWKSPDDELLTLAATDGAIIVMTARDLEPLLEFQPEGQLISE